jgi:hypothetical protein
MFFNKDITKGRLLSGSSPRISNIYMTEMCKICERPLDDGIIILRAKLDNANMIICQDCAYAIHCAYEENL